MYHEAVQPCIVSLIYLDDEHVGARLNLCPSSISMIEEAMAMIGEDSKSTSHRKAPIASLFVTSGWIGPTLWWSPSHDSPLKYHTTWHCMTWSQTCSGLQGCGMCGKPVVDVMFPMRMSSRMRSGCHRRKICFKKMSLSFWNPGPQRETTYLCEYINVILFDDQFPLKDFGLQIEQITIIPSTGSVSRTPIPYRGCEPRGITFRFFGGNGELILEVRCIFYPNPRAKDPKKIRLWIDRYVILYKL